MTGGSGRCSPSRVKSGMAEEWACALGLGLGLGLRGWLVGELLLAFHGLLAFHYVACPVPSVNPPIRRPAASSQQRSAAPNDHPSEAARRPPGGQTEKPKPKQDPDGGSY
ncbi:hypothetical protein SCUP515_06436 [Seiridium cupressi]